MKILIDLDKEILDKISMIAEKNERSRKKMIEVMIISMIRGDKHK